MMDKNRQERMTYEDVKKNQQKLDEQMDKLIKVPYFEDEDEWNAFPNLVSDATYSAGQVMAMKTKQGPLLTYNNGNRRVMLGYDITDMTRKFANMKPDENGNITIDDRGFVFTIHAVELWRFFKSEVQKLYGIAQAEAIHSSKEIERRKGSSTGYDTSNVEGEL